MQSVTVGGLHHNIVSLIRICRILYKRLALVPDITREHKLFLNSVLFKPHLYARRTKQMSDIGKSYLYSLTYIHKLTIHTWSESLYYAIGILHTI